MPRRCAFVLCVVVAGAACADDLYIYPAKNQTPEQQDQDKYQCYQFGKSQTGFDPMAPPPTAQTTESKSGAVRGAAGGALVGAAVGAVSGDTGKGAGYGAAAGATIGALRKRQNTKENEAAQQQ